MKLVEHDDAKIAEQRIALHPRGQNALGRHQKLGPLGEAALESDVPADFFADAPAALLCDAPRDRACRDASRLQQNGFAD